MENVKWQSRTIPTKNGQLEIALANCRVFLACPRGANSVSLLKVTNTSEVPCLVNGSLSLVQREYFIQGPAASSVHTTLSIYATLSKL